MRFMFFCSILFAIGANFSLASSAEIDATGLLCGYFRILTLRMKIRGEANLSVISRFESQGFLDSSLGLMSDYRDIVGVTVHSTFSI